MNKNKKYSKKNKYFQNLFTKRLTKNGQRIIINGKLKVMRRHVMKKFVSIISLILTAIFLFSPPDNSNGDLLDASDASPIG